MERLSLYEPSGYLDMGAVISAPYPFIIAIGCRACGKTYGALKYAYTQHKKFIYFRRTKTQLEIICDAYMNPFKPINRDLNVFIQPEMRKNYAAVYEHIDDDKKNCIGYAAALSTFANLRGFDGSDIELIIWDEFIPEPSEIVKFNEYSALLNAIETINRNREFNGADPVKVVLLSNSNMIYGGIIAGFGLGDDLLRMQEEDLETLEHNPYMLLIRPRSENFKEQKKETALYKITEGSGYSDMALGNNFVIQDRERIQKRPLREYIPIADYAGIIFYRHKTNSTYYATTTRNGTPKTYKDTDADRRRFLNEQGTIWRAYCKRKLFFESVAIQDNFLTIYGC